MSTDQGEEAAVSPDRVTVRLTPEFVADLEYLHSLCLSDTPLSALVRRAVSCWADEMRRTYPNPSGGA